MGTSNGESEAPRGPLEVSETLYIETNDGKSLPFEVVGILEDADDGASYAVLRRNAEEDDEFVVTDAAGNLLEDDALAQEILDDFLAFAEEDDDTPDQNGEPN
ncbi:MAG TPA: hypothetical protein VHT92_11405 [Candidatus Cybelea sp.]|jgi:hypothetical protein|nr:hypothetical protein [Candidatus Cybelea sp.]